MHRAGEYGRALRRFFSLNADRLNHHWGGRLVKEALGFALKLREAMLATKVICSAVIFERSRRSIRGHSHAADRIDCGTAALIGVFIIASHFVDCNAEEP